ncbi:MAG TPA: hypothetical protein DD670_12575 [Planctomycetaceae bacterium]|nr:hypothetical protein [Planctomycetaceae bacterium]
MRMIPLVLLFVALCVAGCLEAKPEPRPVEPQPAAVPPVAEPPKAETPPAVPVPMEPPIVDPQAPASPDPEPSAEAAAEPANPWHPVTPVEPPATVVQPPSRTAQADDQWATEADLGGTASAAGPGMGRQGRSYGADIVTYPIATYFQMRERIGLDQMAKAMQLYQAMNDRYPRTQDEFRNEIIKPNAIRLPMLPDGHKFYYDPEKHELVVIKPRS